MNNVYSCHFIHKFKEQDDCHLKIIHYFCIRTISLKKQVRHFDRHPRVTYKHTAEKYILIIKNRVR